MKKTLYTAPEAEWLEAVNANCFLQSPGGTIPSLTEDDTYVDINW